MSRILFAWELGGGYGHLGPFRDIAQALMARGHEITVAARDVERAQVVFGRLPLRVVQAPICTKTYNGLAEPPLNYAEILMRYGYLDAPQLAGLLRAWRDLLDLTRAELLIADHAPSALLAGRGTRVARLVTGSPFTVPPRMSPTPNMRPWVDVPAQRLANSDASVMDCINGSLSAGVAKLAAVSELFDGAEFLLSGVAELDPYGPQDSRHYLGLYAGLIGSLPPRWPAGTGQRVFAYLNSDYRHLDAALSALAASGSRCVVFVLGISPALRQKHESERLVFSEGLLDLDRSVNDCDYCVCHGNFGTVCEVLRRGKPLLVLPMDLEKFLLASAVANRGLGCFVHPETPNPDFAAAIATIATGKSYSDAAREFGLQHREPPVDTIVERAASRIEALARTQGKPG